MESLTTEFDPEQALSACLDSVNLIDRLVAIGPTARNKLAVSSNAEHLKIMLGKGVSNSQTVAAVEAATTFAALDEIEDSPEPSRLTYIADISPRQIRMALTRAGLREAVEAAVATGNQDLKDWYEFSTTFERKNAQVIAMGAALGVDDAALDSLWALGATL